MNKMGCCGDVCEICPRFTATQSGHVKNLRKVAVLWRIVGWWEDTESPKELTRHGCASISHCDLRVRECVLGKSIENCGQCTEYPCARLLAIFEQNEKDADIYKTQFSAKDYQIFQKAFFSKKERLDKINSEKYTS